MKITNIETILAGQRYLFVKVHTDTGLVGYGECGAWCYQEATAECIHAMEHHLIGLDPLNIEYINNGLTRCMHFRGSVVMAAISGIDIALWDLKGKYYNAPIYELLGGKVRDKARIYVNFKAKTPEDFAKKALDLKNQGYTAIRYSIGHPEDENGRCGEIFSQVVYRMERQMAAIREAVGWETDIAIECHRGLTPAQAIECAHALKPYRPYFYEDPIPDNMAAMTKLTEEIDLPVATGERHRREHHGDALGQDDVAHPLQIVEALSLCGLELALRHRLDGGADDLAHVSAGVNAQCNDAGADDAEAHACKCQRIIQEAQLQQQRGVLDELDVNAGDDAQQLTAAGGHQAQRSADDEGQRQCADGGLQRVAQTQQKTLTMRPDGGPGL